MPTNYDELLDHDYDGIREYDNPLPGWWRWLFILSCVFSVFYYVYFHLGVGPSLQDNYEAASLMHLERQFASFGELTPDNQTILMLANERAEDIAAIKGMFAGNCGQCHRADGGGNIGPNLADSSWKNVKEPADIFTAITEGIPGTAMTAWDKRLREPQRILLASYVVTLQGTNPPNAKAAEGSVIAPWTYVPAADDADESADESAEAAETEEGT